jgi:pimeloyl-ACP methyl ester carboxylesterase
VYDILVKDGYTVSVVQEPLTSFDSDVAATRRILAMQSGPTVLVGHSYGGIVIPQAGNDSHVVSLVYVAAHIPDAGENEAGDGKKFRSDLAKSQFIKSASDNFNYLDSDSFSCILRRGSTHGAGQIWGSLPDVSFHSTLRRHRHHPGVAQQRANSHTSEIAGASHSVYESHPKEVASVIEKAAQAASK